MSFFKDVVTSLVNRIAPTVSYVERQNIRTSMSDNFDTPSAHAGNSRGFYIGSVSAGNLKDWNPPTSDADSELSYDLVSLQNRSRDAIRNYALARGIINTKVTNVISTGIFPHPNVDFERLGISEDAAYTLNKSIKDEFSLFAESQDFDISGGNNFYQSQSIMYRSRLEAGNVLGLLTNKRRRNNPYITRLQIIEGDLLVNKNYMPDTETLTAEGGDVVGYQFLSAYQNTQKITKKRNEWREVAKYGTRTGLQNVVHLFDQTRPGQHKGVPELTTVIYLLKQLYEYTKATIDASLLAARINIFVKTDGTVKFGENQEEIARNEYTVNGNRAINLAEGESIEFNDPTYPNANFDSFVISILKQISSSTEIPVELLVKSFAASYAASRVNMLDFSKLVFRERQTLVSDFCQPVYERFMYELALSGRVALPGYLSNPDPMIRLSYLKANWVGSHAATSINPLQDINAARIAIDMGLTTLESETLARYGRSWTDQQGQRAREKAIIRAQNMEFNEDV